MQIYNVYNKDKNNTEQQPIPVADFFRREINETRTFIRHINTNKKFSPSLVRLAKAKKSQKVESVN